MTIINKELSVIAIINTNFIFNIQSLTLITPYSYNFATIPKSKAYQKKYYFD